MEPLQQWNYKEHGKYDSRLELYHNHLLHYPYYLKEGEPPVQLNFEQVLASDFFYGTLKITYELIDYVMTLTLPEELSAAAQRAYLFYKYFKQQRITSDNYQRKDSFNSDHQHFYNLSPYGIEHFVETEQKVIIKARQRFDQFFFKGPKMINLPYATRLHWRNSIWKALDSASPFSKEDAFPLFDYTKIIVHKFTYKHPDQNSGEHIEIHPGFITIAGWQGRDGGSHNVSIESVWFDPTLIHSDLQEHRLAIIEILAQAIKEGDKKHPLLELKDKKALGVVKKDNQLPGEAPPA